MLLAAVLTQFKPVSITTGRPISAVVPKIMVTRPRLAHPIVTKSKLPIRRHITCSQSPKTNPSQSWLGSQRESNHPICVHDNPQYALKDNGVIDSGCSRHMTWNMFCLSDFEELNGGYVAFEGNPKGSKISGKGKIKTCKLDFKDVYIVKELKFNLFSVSQMCDKKNRVLFTDTACLILSSDFKLADESQVLLRVHRENNMYNVHLKNIVPSGDLTCLFAKASIDESNLWHQRLAHINFQTINKLVKGNLVRGLPTKVFENDNTCVACKKGKQHIASCKTKLVSSVDQPLFKLHMDLFGPTFVKILNKKSYCLVVTDDYIRVLVTKPHNKTPYELLHGRTSSIGFMRPFGCHVTILNTLDSLGKFEGKVDEGFLVGYFVSSKAFRVFNSSTRIVQETFHVNFLKNKPNVVGSGPTWLFDIDSLTKTMNYQPIIAGNQPNPSASFQDKFDAEKPEEEINQQYMLFPVWSSGSINPKNNDGDAAFDGKEHDFNAKKPDSEVILSPSSSAQSRKQDDKTKKEAKGKSPVESLTGYRDLSAEFEDFSDNISNEVNAAGTIVHTVGQNSSNSTNPFSAASPSNTTASPTHGKSSFIDASQLFDDPDMPELEDITYSDDENDVGAEADFNNLEPSITVSPIPTTRIYKDHHVSQIIGNLSSTTQTRSMTKVVKDQGGLSQMFNDDFYTYMFACFLLQEEPKRVLIDLSHGKRAIGTKWVYRNKKDKIGILVRNKARLIAQGHTQEEGIDYEEVFALVARIKAIRLFLAYTSLMGFMVYQMNVKSAFLYGTIEEEVYDCQPPGFEDPDPPNKVYKVVKVKQKIDEIFISQDKYVAEILRKFGLTEGKSASTLIDTEKPLLKDPDGEDVDVHTYRLISWQCKKQTVVATSSIKVEYVAVASAVHRHKLLLFSLTNWCCLLSVVRSSTLVDKKKVAVTEAVIREVLRLDNAEGVDCLPNEEIFTELARMGYDKPSTTLTFYKAFFSSQWKFLIHIILLSMSAKLTSSNEFSSTMTSAVICLSTGRKFNFSKYIFDSLVRNVDSTSKFYMYPHFLQLLIRKQVGDLSTHTTKYASPTLTQKVFANMRRVGKGFSRIETPLFKGMLVGKEIEEEGDADEHVEDVIAGDDAQEDDTAAHREVLTVTQEPSIPSPIPTIPPSQPPQDFS
nr:ribonuclease H-like domain-containing protein [Tanacetum cinerariifolium]